MITFSATVQALFASGFVQHFHLVEIYDNIAAVVIKRITSHSADVTLSDARVFVADGTLLSVEPPQISTDVDREQFIFTIADPAFLGTGYAENGLIGKRAEIRMGFLSASGVPLTDIANTLLVYKGRIDGVGYGVKTEEIGESVLQITCASPVADLDMKKFIITSKESARARNIEDSSCDMVYGGSGTLSLKWGKK